MRKMICWLLNLCRRDKVKKFSLLKLKAFNKLSQTRRFLTSFQEIHQKASTSMVRRRKRKSGLKNQPEKNQSLKKWTKRRLLKVISIVLHELIQQKDQINKYGRRMLNLSWMKLKL
jgi:hypothetical protein